MCGSGLKQFQERSEVTDLHLSFSFYANGRDRMYYPRARVIYNKQKIEVAVTEKVMPGSSWRELLS